MSATKLVFHKTAGCPFQLTFPPSNLHLSPCRIFVPVPNARTSPPVCFLNTLVPGASPRTRRGHRRPAFRRLLLLFLLLRRRLRRVVAFLRVRRRKLGPFPLNRPGWVVDVVRTPVAGAELSPAGRKRRRAVIALRFCVGLGCGGRLGGWLLVVVLLLMLLLVMLWVVLLLVMLRVVLLLVRLLWYAESTGNTAALRGSGGAPILA